MSNESFKLEGMDKLLNSLNGLPEHLAQKVLEEYLKTTSQKFIVNSLKSGLSYGAYTESKIKVTKDKIKTLAFISGPTTDAFWLRFVDRGTKERTILKGDNKGANRGRIIGKHQIKGIVDGQIKLIIDDVEKGLGAEIDAYLKKNNNTI